MGVHFVLHTLIGIRPRADALVVRPNLPLAARVEGSSYTARLWLRGRELRITLQPLGVERCRVTVNDEQTELAWGEELVARAL